MEGKRELNPRHAPVAVSIHSGEERNQSAVLLMDLDCFPLGVQGLLREPQSGQRLNRDGGCFGIARHDGAPLQRPG